MWDRKGPYRGTKYPTSFWAEAREAGVARGEVPPRGGGLRAIRHARVPSGTRLAWDTTCSMVSKSPGSPAARPAPAGHGDRAKISRTGATISGSAPASVPRAPRGRSRFPGRNTSHQTSELPAAGRVEGLVEDLRRPRLANRGQVDRADCAGWMFWLMWKTLPGS